MQAILLAALPPAIDSSVEFTASQWRTFFVEAGVGDFQAWNQVRTSASQRQLWLVAGEPAANEFLVSNLDGIAGVLAETCNGPVPIELIQRPVGVRTSTDKLWAYRIPRLVVEKKPGDWSEHFKPKLDPDIRNALERKLERSIRKELAVWGRLPDVLDNDAPFLTLAQSGRAMPIPAITASRSGHGKPVNVLTRLQVVFLSYWKLEGNLFLGPLSSLGYGRMARTAAPEEIDRELQKALLDIIPTDSPSEVLS